MAVYYSFHYSRDAWRVQQVVNMGAIDGQTILNSQAWEEIKRRGDAAIEAWIAEQMQRKTAVVVLVGTDTANRRWVRYEIAKAWDERRPLVGIRIHGLADRQGRTDLSGDNPFERVRLQGGGTVASHVPLHSPGGVGSQAVYASIRANLRQWVAGAYARP